TRLGHPFCRGLGGVVWVLMWGGSGPFAKSCCASPDFNQVRQFWTSAAAPAALPSPPKCKWDQPAKCTVSMPRRRYPIELARKRARRASRSPSNRPPGRRCLFPTGTSTRSEYRDVASLPRIGRAECAREMRRVLEPGRRVQAVDFAEPEG